jgi:hypothetical protein
MEQRCAQEAREMDYFDLIAAFTQEGLKVINGYVYREDGRGIPMPKPRRNAPVTRGFVQYACKFTGIPVERICYG